MHLKDKNFATPKVDEDALKAKRERELAEETERLKKEYEEKQKKKKEKESKDKEEDSKKAEEEKKKSGGIYGFFERQFKGEPDKPAEEASTPPPPPEDEPRVFELKPSVMPSPLSSHADPLQSVLPTTHPEEAPS